MKRENYLQIQGWMVLDLQLSGNELLAYALIYGFSQDSRSEFCGSNKYIMEWLNISKSTCIRVLQNLVDKGLLIKREEEVMTGIFKNYYRAVIPEKGEISNQNPESYELDGGCQNETGGVSKCDPYNNNNNNIKKTIPNGIVENPAVENGNEAAKTPKSLEVIECYNEICKSLSAVTKVTDKRLQTVRTRLKKFSFEEIRQVFRLAESSSFLKGDNDRNWKADFDWLMNENNMVKVLEGKYNNDKLPVEFDKYWKLTFGAYPKDENEGDARKIWTGKIMAAADKKDMATRIYKAVQLYVINYSENNGDGYRYMPSFNKWLTSECDHWIEEVYRDE